MKKIILFIFIIPLFSFGQSEVKLEYWDNGNILSQVHYVDGVRDGSCRNYHKNGILMDEGFYKDGKMTGIWISYYDNGQTRVQGKYNHENKNVNSERIGTWIEYYTDGKIAIESTIIDGKENRKYFNQDGSENTNPSGC